MAPLFPARWSFIASTCLVLGLALPVAPAAGLSLVKGSTVAGAPLSLDVGAALFVRYRASKSPGLDLSRSYELQRARLAFDLRFGQHLRVVIEPDFAGADADLADTYLEIIPLPELTFRFGQSETPFGILETIGRFRMPSLSRGMISELMSDRTGFGGRRQGGSMKLKLKEWPLKPELEVGVYGDFSSDLGVDAAARLRLKPAKGLSVDLAWYHRLDATVERGHGNAVELGALWDRGMLFAMLDVWLAHSRLFRKDNLLPTENGLSLSVRALVALRFSLDEDLSVEPYVGGAILDPQLKAGSDLGFDATLGLSLRAWGRLRLGVEGELERGQSAFSTLDLMRATAFIGIELQ